MNLSGLSGNIIRLEISFYADDNTPYTYGDNWNTVSAKLEICSNSLFKWFIENHLKANADKCHLLTTSNETVTVNANGFEINNSTEEKLLGIKIDRQLSFESHFTSLCKKASQKLHALTRIIKYMDIVKRKMLMKAFVTSQFTYCPLIWVLHSRKLNNRINYMHERALRLVYKDDLSSFNELLGIDNSVSIHHRNLQALAIKIFKLKNGYSHDILQEIFELREPPYNLRTKENIFERKILEQLNMVFNLLSI